MEAADAEWLADLAKRHLRRYPAAEPIDLYKLLHQSAMGPAHAVSDVVGARSRLQAEAREARSRIGSAAARLEPLWDPIAPDGSLGRVHLMPYLAAGRLLESLLLAFVRTAEVFKPEPELLAARCRTLIDLARAGRLNVPANDLSALIARMATDGYPAAHHSSRYRTTYRPAYRIVHGRHLS